MHRRTLVAIGVLVIAWVAAFALPFASETLSPPDAGPTTVEYSIGEVITGASDQAEGGLAGAWRYLPVFFSLLVVGGIVLLGGTGRDGQSPLGVRLLVISTVATIASAAALVVALDLTIELGIGAFALLLIAVPFVAIALTIGQKLLYPAMAYVILFSQIPFLFTIYYSFRDYRLNRPDQDGFNGGQNYVRLWEQIRDTNSPFFAAVINTVVLTAGSVILAVILGLFLAELVNHRFPGRTIVRTLLITPFLIMPAAASLSWKNLLYNPNFGFLDWFTVTFLPGNVAPNWLGEYPVASIMIYLIWRWAPFMMLIFLAGMGSISEEVREAARVDGASAWEEFRSVTLPHLRRFFMLGGLLGTVYIFQDFDPVYLMTQGGPGNESTNLSYRVFDVATSGNYGQASAIGVVTVILSIIAVTYLVRLLSRVFEGELSSGR